MSGERPGRQTREEILAAQSGPRELVLDEHMYRVEQQGKLRATFRLQVFTAPGLRPVVVATQVPYEGMSLVNGCESFCTHVWRTRFPDQEQPPVWVQRLVHQGVDRWQLVTFDVDADGALHAPRWPRLSQEQLDTLVGVPVDPARGSGFVPWPKGPEYRMRYTLTQVAGMPMTQAFRTTCMSGVARRRNGWAYRVLRRFRPLIHAACCQYHGGDWRTVNRHAIRFLRHAESADVDPEDITRHVVTAARAEHLTEWEVEALRSLFDDPIEVGDGEPPMYVNGQHRVQAMRDAGVVLTVTGHWEQIDGDHSGW